MKKIVIIMFVVCSFLVTKNNVLAYDYVNNVFGISLIGEKNINEMTEMFTQVDVDIFDENPVCVLFVGINGANGGRSIPLIRPTNNCPPTKIAPELPADTKASASPFFTSPMATEIEESFFLRIAITGGSAVSITSVAFTTSTCS